MDITISVQELYRRVVEMQEDGMDYVTIWIQPPEDNEPAALFLEASTKSEPFMGVEYDSIDALDRSN